MTSINPAPDASGTDADARDDASPADTTEAQAPDLPASCRGQRVRPLLHLARPGAYALASSPEAGAEAGLTIHSPRNGFR